MPRKHKAFSPLRILRTLMMALTEIRTLARSNGKPEDIVRLIEFKCTQVLHEIFNESKEKSAVDVPVHIDIPKDVPQGEVQ